MGWINGGDRNCLIKESGGKRRRGKKHGEEERVKPGRYPVAIVGERKSSTESLEPRGSQLFPVTRFFVAPHSVLARPA